MFRTLTLVALVLTVGCNRNKDENPDVDGDGYKASTDCNDQDKNINPDAAEMCDGIDNNCDDEVDEDNAEDAQSWYADSDADGYGDPDTVLVSCDQPSGYISDNSDCNDTSTAFYPGAPEDDCTDPNDYNCDGSVGYADVDGDGFPACEECNDADANANPGLDETCGDGIDNNCDELIDDPTSVDAPTWYIDYDGDGFGSQQHTKVECEQPSGFVGNDLDCQDFSADAYPDDPDTPELDAGLEYCDGLDNDCDGFTDEADALDVTVWFADTDSDGFGDVLNNIAACDEPTGYVDDSSDCDDTSADINPDADEYCNAVDDNCDNVTDEDSAVDAATWYQDSDNDGYGTFQSSIDACAQPSGYAATGQDCNDTAYGVNPGATEVCNSVDDDCDGITDPATSIGATTWYFDSDGDGFGDINSWSQACTQPANWVDSSLATDCDDADADVNPDAIEVCNDGIDNDCDGSEGECALSLADADTVFSGVAGSQFGSGITTGDINGDGNLDIVIGAPNENGNNGAIYLYYGPISSAALGSSDADVTINGSGGRKVGSCLEAGTDIDGDTFFDLLICTKKYEGSQGSNQGAARMFYGPITNGTYAIEDADLHLTGEAILDYAGQTIAYPGDVNNDGYDDILVGADGWDDYFDGGALNDRNGAAYIVYGPVTGADPTTGELSLGDSSITQLTGTHNNEGVGKGFGPARDTLTGAGDINGDGINDIIIGASNSDRNTTDAGTIYLVHGVDSTLGDSIFSGSLDGADTILTGTTNSEKAGQSVNPAGDVTDDGYDDFLVGASGNDDNGTNTGAIYVIPGSGSANGIANGDLSGASVAMIYGGTTNEQLHVAAGGGDVNNDGQPDVLVGAYSISSEAGIAYLFTGPLSGSLTPADAAGTFEGEDIGSRAGVAITFAGDIDNSGTGDSFLIGASGSGSDKVYLVLSVGQ